MLECLLTTQHLRNKAVACRSHQAYGLYPLSLVEPSQLCGDEMSLKQTQERADRIYTNKIAG